MREYVRLHVSLDDELAQLEQDRRILRQAADVAGQRWRENGARPLRRQLLAMAGDLETRAADLRKEYEVGE